MLTNIRQQRLHLQIRSHPEVPGGHELGKMLFNPVRLANQGTICPLSQPSCVLSPHSPWLPRPLGPSCRSSKATGVLVPQGLCTCWSSCLEGAQSSLLLFPHESPYVAPPEVIPSITLHLPSVDLVSFIPLTPCISHVWFWSRHLQESGRLGALSVLFTAGSPAPKILRGTQ